MDKVCKKAQLDLGLRLPGEDLAFDLGARNWCTAECGKYTVCVAYASRGINPRVGRTASEAATAFGIAQGERASNYDNYPNTLTHT